MISSPINSIYLFLASDYLNCKKKTDDFCNNNYYTRIYLYMFYII